MIIDKIKPGGLILLYIWSIHLPSILGILRRSSDVLGNIKKYSEFDRNHITKRFEKFSERFSRKIPLMVGNLRLMFRKMSIAFKIVGKRFKNLPCSTGNLRYTERSKVKSFNRWGRISKRHFYKNIDCGYSVVARLQHCFS